MQSNDPINAYYNVLIAIIKQAIDDYFKGILSEEGLESCLHDFFSDDNKVSMLMNKIRKRRIKHEEKKTKQSSTKKRNQKSNRRSE